MFLTMVCLTMVAVSCQDEKASKTKLIGFSQCTVGDTWRQVMHQEMMRELSFHPDINLIIKDAANDNQKQIDQIKDLVATGVDLLIVSPNEEAPITPLLDSVFDSGVPILLIDRKTNSDKYTAYVGADNYEIGQTAGKYIALQLEGQGKIMEVWGLRGSSPAIGRHEGMIDALAEYPKIEVIAEVDGKWEAEFVTEGLTTNLAKTPNVDLIYAHNDRMALAVHEVLETFKSSQKIRVIGVDGLPGPGGGVDLVDQGVLDATLLYPTGGGDAVRISADILNHQPFKKDNYLPTTVIDPRNVRIMKLQWDEIRKGQEGLARLQLMIDQLRQVFSNQRELLYILITSLILSILLGVWLFKSLRERSEAFKRLEAQNEKIRKQRNQIIKISEEAKIATQGKLRFFTNMSHEFRTPLTLILGTVESLLSGRIEKKENKEDLGLMRQNALRLLRLVNQLMNFRKIESNKMQLRVSENDLVRFIEVIMKAYNNMAEKRGIKFRLFAKEKSIPMWFDANLLDKVLFNLLSNAFKFTRDGGEITVTIDKNMFENQVTIAVEDDGRGMSPEHVAHAFDRFYQGEHYNSKGTGLGLSLSKELILLHQGTIDLWSEKHKGTRFEVKLKLGKEHFNENQMALDIPTIKYDDAPLYVEQGNDSEILAYPKVEGSSVLFSPKSRELQLLIIEDHQELGHFLKSKLIPHYDIILEVDGAAGLKSAFRLVPDLIICDISLPNMNGLKVCKALKSDLRTSHIPIVMLTANASDDQKIKGIQMGADDYITKPFSLRFLTERIKNLLLNRELQKQHFAIREEMGDEVESNMSKLDSQFTKQFVAFVGLNYQRQDFEMSDLVKEFGLSRAQLYRKVKALFGQSVMDYIQIIRLSAAKRHLEQNDLNISEIAYQVGYTSPGYFSTAFKSRFNCSPSDFRNSLRTSSQ